MEEQIIKFETAKLAKEKGFDLECRFHYDLEFKEVSFNPEYDLFKNSEIEEGIGKLNFKMISAPSQGLLQKWFRDVYNIDISIITNYSTYKKGELTLNKSYRVGIIYVNEGLIESFFIRPKDDNFKFIEFNTYEEALEEGLIKALNLI